MLATKSYITAETYDIGDDDGDVDVYEEDFDPTTVLDVQGPSGYEFADIPNGRSLMTATEGYIAPELAGKLPGYVSTSMGNKFADISDGLAAFFDEGAHIKALEGELPFGAEYDRYAAAAVAAGFYDFMGYVDFVEYMEDGEGCTSLKSADKLVGDFSPTMGIKFTDIPNGLATIATPHVEVNTPSRVECIRIDKDDEEEDDYENEFFPNSFMRQCQVEHEITMKVPEMDLKWANTGHDAVIPMIGPFADEDGGITPELVGKLPGIKFADVPNGLAALQDLAGFWNLAGLKESMGGLPGHVPPTMGSKFVDLPNGLAAISKKSAYYEALDDGGLPGNLSLNMGSKVADFPKGLAAFSKKSAPRDVLEDAAPEAHITPECTGQDPAADVTATSIVNSLYSAA